MVKLLDPKSKYSAYIPKPRGGSNYAGSGNAKFAVNLIIEVAKANFKEAAALAKVLKAPSLEQTLRNIHAFVYRNFQYQAEGLEHELQTLSRAFWDYREKGINCEDTTLITLQILSNLGIRSYVRRIHQAQAPQAATHVYVVVPKNQKTAKIDGPNSYFVVDGTLAHFNQEAHYLKAIDVMAEPQVKYTVLNGPNCPGQQAEIVGPHPTKPNLIIVLLKPSGQKVAVPASGLNNGAAAAAESAGGGSDAQFWVDAGKAVANIASKINWKSIGWDEEGRTMQEVKSIMDNNGLHLYPAKKHGGPWRDNLGAGRLDIMTPDELRYFIEYRIPVWKRNMDGKNWGKTKDRVIKRYYRVADILKDAAIEVFKSKYGCYTHSGLYNDIVAAYPKGSQKLADSASWQIKSFKEDCAAGSGSAGTLPFVSGGGTQPTGGGAQQAGFSFSKSLPTVLLLSAGLGLGYQIMKSRKKQTA